MLNGRVQVALLRVIERVVLCQIGQFLLLERQHGLLPPRGLQRPHLALPQVHERGSAGSGLEPPLLLERRLSLPRLAGCGGRRPLIVHSPLLRRTSFGLFATYFANLWQHRRPQGRRDRDS